MKQWVLIWVLLVTCFTFGMAAPGWCNKPPEPFDLLLPADGAVTSTTVLLDWESTTDQDGDLFSYTLYLSEDETFPAGDNLLQFPKEGLTTSAFTLTSDHGIQTETVYYWKVEAIDEFGNIRESTTTRQFETDNNANPGDLTVSGTVYDADTSAPIEGAEIPSGETTLPPTDEQGHYQDVVSYTGETYIVLVTAPGYIPEEVTVTGVSQGEAIEKEISLRTDHRGDVDGADGVTLADAVLALMILTGGDLGGTSIQADADVDGDGAGPIGLPEVIFILRKVGGM